MRALEQSGLEAVGAYHSRSIRGSLALDVKNLEAVQNCLVKIQPTVVFLAVNTPGGVDRCETHPEEARLLHVEGTRHLVQAAQAIQAKLVYYSSDYVFDGQSGPYREEDPPSPLSVYARTKCEAEEVVRQMADHLIIRTTAVYGWDRSSPNFAMQIWERLQAGQTMDVPDDQWGNPTLADYLAEASVRLVQIGVRGTVNVVGKDRLPRSELAQVLAKMMLLDQGLIRPMPTARLNQKARRPLQGGLITDKLMQLLGTQPLNLEESLKRFRRRWRADTHVQIPGRAISDEAQRLKQQILDQVRRYWEIAHQGKPFVPFKTRIQYAGRVFGPEEMTNLVDSALDFWLTLGPYGELFENKMKLFLGVRDFALVNSGSTANLTAVMALCSRQLERPLKPGDEVVTPAVTFPTTLAPLVHSGLIPVFVDAEVGTYNIKAHLVEEAISPKTRALMIPHTLGNPFDLDIITEIAKRHNLYLIEDMCDALGSTFRGRLVGTFGDLATISFFPAHHITLGEGGGVVINISGLSRIVRSVRDWGRDCWCVPGESNTCGKRFGWQLGGLPKGYDHKYIYSNLGYNFKPTDLQAAIGVAQIDRIKDFTEQRRANFRLLYEGLERYQDYLILPKLDPRSNPSWFGFPITIKNNLSRHELVQWLENANIETREVFGGNVLKQPGYKGIPARIFGTLEETDIIMNRTFFIGVYPGLTEEIIGFILERFDEFFRTRLKATTSQV
jgi:CDP-6-deoxy-D-xylo-4-hexulose-3-dehydrase